MRSSGRVTKDYHISLVTPLFGGGVAAGAPDETLPIRGTSIRGQLQFWWRATRGAGFASHKALSAGHAEIWGTIDRASPVEIEVREVTASPVRPCARYEWNPKARGGQGGWRLVWESPFVSSPLSYALFPFQGSQPRSGEHDSGVSPAKCIVEASFTLRLRYPQEFDEEVETAARYWVNFGGLGARTRRGCGALLCKELAAKNPDDLGGWFAAASTGGTGNGREWPTAPDGALVGNEPEAPLEAWKKAIGLLQKFRQGEGIGRNPGHDGRPGRSRYPEPEVIRRVTARRSREHARLAQIPDDAFPRAEFGLPIGFHFKDEWSGDPPDTVLYPPNADDGESRERMASPLILKPLALANGNAVPLIVCLITPTLAGVELRQGDGALPLPRDTVVSGKRLAEYQNSPLAGSSSGSAVEAFLLHARKYGYRHISR